MAIPLSRRRYPSSVCLAFASQLKKLRIDYGKRTGAKISQFSFAMLLGIHKDRYGSYERADREPPLEFLAKLRGVTGASLDHLIGGATSTAESRRPAP